jgi:hypothetical protein
MNAKVGHAVNLYKLIETQKRSLIKLENELNTTVGQMITKEFDEYVITTKEIRRKE